MPGGAMKSDAPRGRGVPPVHLLVRLELPNKPPREFSYDFRQEVITIGRDPANDIQIPLTTVSRNHARLFYELGDFFLEDLGSTHGTNHNGKRLGSREKRLLRDGDQISVMSFQLTFKTSMGTLLDRQPGEKTEALARRMVQEVLSSLGGPSMEPPSLRVMDGVDEGRRLEIQEDQAEITLGRSPECDFVLNDQNISRRHALIKRTWNGFTVQDLGSKNGVIVNGKRAEGAQAIKDGDELQIGGIKLIFIDPASRILDQFGVLAEETVAPEGAEAPEEGDQAGAAAGDEEGEGDGEEDAAGESADQEPPETSGPAHDLAPDEQGDAGDPPRPEGAGELVPPPKTGGGAEVAILIIGALFLMSALGLAVWLYL
ncbi:MAG: FHA domain-containing protein [Deltaproteobacteria bacterium]|nr:FHA domain-containing protein [Deltaproteobacteria bacterium]